MNYLKQVYRTDRMKRAKKKLNDAQKKLAGIKKFYQKELKVVKRKVVLYNKKHRSH